MQQMGFECQLAPVGDPNMKVEWFLNNKPLAHSKYDMITSSVFRDYLLTVSALILCWESLETIQRLCSFLVCRKSFDSDLWFRLRRHELRLGVSGRQRRIPVPCHQSVWFWWNEGGYQNSRQTWYHLRVTAAEGHEKYWNDQRDGSILANVRLHTFCLIFFVAEFVKVGSKILLYKNN